VKRGKKEGEIHCQESIKKKRKEELEWGEKEILFFYTSEKKKGIREPLDNGGRKPRATSLINARRIYFEKKRIREEEREPKREKEKIRRHILAKLYSILTIELHRKGTLLSSSFSP